jgi:formate hydrogenlyase subunit 3/multisubunit Na+/H+ antiporter MnhD subunit
MELTFVIFALFASAISLALYCLPRVSKYVFFTLLGLSGLSAVWAGMLVLINQQKVSYQIYSSFPNIVLHFALDPLSSFFLVIIGIIVTSIAFYGPSYMCSYERHHSVVSMSFFTGLFVSGMYLVLLAHDIFTFMLSWELMSVSSYFLVAYHHEHEKNRRVALVYMLMAQASGLLILFAFSILVKFTGCMGFDNLHSTELTPIWAGVAFFLAFFGFGMKAGIVPLHVWLPQAHPVAPSHISALMSGVMLKIAIYGFVRFSFDLLKGNTSWQWGCAVLLVGVVSALFGILGALMQNNIKRLLAYSSIENIGIIFIGLGLSLIFTSQNCPLFAALCFVGSMYHCLNHAIFKSLLFLGAGVILQQCDEHNMENMGGLIKRMPHVAWCFLIGCMSISALPPFNGFVSEWLIFQGAFHGSLLNSAVMRTLIPVAAAMLALTSAIALTCFVKLYSVVFLGQERTACTSHAGDPKWGMRLAIGLLSVLCIIFGLLPNFVISILSVITNQLLGVQLPLMRGSLWLIPIAPSVASYSSLLIFVSVSLICLMIYLLLNWYVGKTKLRSAKPWDCGYGGINSRMQYTATAFVMPLRRIFSAVWFIEEEIKKTDSGTRYYLHIGDRVWRSVYVPIEHIILVLSRLFARLQGGNIRVYLAYIFITLILLLMVVA